MAYSRNELLFFKPYNFTITDVYGESITLSRSEESGDVLGMGVEEWTEDGEPRVVKISGNFHNDLRQNAINQLARLKGMVAISEQKQQELVMIVPHPQIQMRGRITNLTGPTWASSPSPFFFTFDIEFTKALQPRQPRLFRDLIEVTAAEGKPYITFAIPNSDYTNLRELAFTFFGVDYSDGQKIRKILELNGLSITDARHLSAGQVLKVPIKW